MGEPWGERWGLRKADMGAWVGLPVAGPDPGTGMAPQWLSSSRGLWEEESGQLDDMDMGSCLMVTPKNCWPPMGGGGGCGWWCWCCWWCMGRWWGAVGEGALLSCVDP